MSVKPPKRIAVLDRLDHAQGFGGAATLGLIDQALTLAGFETLDAAPLLEQTARRPERLPDAWVTVSDHAQHQDAERFCHSQSLPHHYVDPTLSHGSETSPHQRDNGSNHLTIAPFLDPGPYFAAQRDAASLRQNLSQRHALPVDRSWIFLSIPSGCETSALFSTFEILSRLYMLDWNLIVSAAEEHHDQASQLLPGLSGKSRYLLQKYDVRERIAFMAASDLCLSVERSGGGVMDLLEALASGLAVVANKSAETEAIVENGVTGRLSAAGNPASLSNDLTFLLRHDNFLQSYRGKTREQVAERHDIHVAARRLRRMVTREDDLC
ncbi:glycosyltransferase [Denitrobaculum tricleocarpae]|uniref:Glycosyltransferase family 4 protein n=1 Tax=Denitrobaculum tricleocarpae TaxID=2591009 RepID=A0A545TT94_9PROT|nr:glycosyltransferase [Denitrobaculum tricleocarpae]TQV80440.1 glycosyltransferase family 4 protein [Denitrobaculum tricleocarpae]